MLPKAFNVKITNIQADTEIEVIEMRVRVYNKRLIALELKYGSIQIDIQKSLKYVYFQNRKPKNPSLRKVQMPRRLLTTIKDITHNIKIKPAMQCYCEKKNCHKSTRQAELPKTRKTQMRLLTY